MQNNLSITITIANCTQPLVVTQLIGKEELSSPFHFTIKVFTNQQKLSLQNIIKKAITLKISPSKSLSIRTINGIITGIEEIHLQDQTIKYILEISAKFKLLDEKKHCRIFKQQSTIEIIHMLFRENTIDACITQLHQQYPKHEYCVQYQESTFNFISRLLEEAGINYYFKHSENAHTMVLIDHPAYFTKASANYPIAFWKKILSIYNSNITLASQTELSAPQKLQAQFGHARLASLQNIKSCQQYSFNSRYTCKDRLLQQAQIESQRTQCQQIDYISRSTYVNFYPGLCFNDIQCNEFIIKTIQHRASSKLQSYQNQITCIPSTQHICPMRKAAIPQIEGAQIATVFGPSSTKIHTDNYARVQVQFDWANTPSNWIRVCQISCGNSWGAQFIPRVGNKVLIRFLDGNPDRPIICGSLYDSQHKPPLDLPKQHWQRGFSFGHQLVFNDTPNQENIQISSLGDIRMNVARNLHTDIRGNETLSVAHGNYCIQSNTGKINLQASAGIELRVGNQQILITSQGIKICGKQITLVP